MSRYGSPTYSEVLTAARAAVAVFDREGVDSCLVGGVACKLYGNDRTPNDVDLVVLDNTTSQEELKRMLCNADSRFYTVASKNPYANYRVLWFRLSTPYSSYSSKACKVDILQPGIMNIPRIVPDQIEWKGYPALPLMPFVVVFLLKLQAWEDHKNALKAYLISKQYTDAADLERLLTIAEGLDVYPLQETWLPAAFLTAAKRRVKLFVASHPHTRTTWRRLGFSTS